MIERIELHNFQRHLFKILELSSTVTVICGPTDAGKSSALRCLRWITFNRPSGDGFIRWGDSDCKGVLTVDGRTVTRCKGKAGNYYLFDEETYRAFGQDVPGAIAEFLNLDPIQFAGQHDPPFWLSLPPAQVARELNRIVNLDLIDAALSNLAATARKAKAEVEVSKGRLRVARERRDELKWVKEANAELKAIEELYERVQGEVRKIALAERLSAEVSRIKERITTLSESNLALQRLCEAGDRVAVIQNRITSMEESLTQVRSVRQAICQTEKVLGQIRDKLASVKECPACGKMMSPPS